MLPSSRRPTLPGEIIQQEYLSPLNLNSEILAQAMEVSVDKIDDILSGNLSINPDFAFRLSKAFNTTPEFWLQLQLNVDMWDTLKSFGREYDKIRRVA